MKKVFTFILAAILTASVFAQAPEKMSYQAVIRDASNNLVTNQTVGMQISILQGSAEGTPIYTETQIPTTNDNGLVSLEIGTGTTSNDFSTIDWANGTFYLKTEIDPTGGSSYTIIGTSQLLSAPYALYAKKAESASWSKNENDIYYNSGNVGIGTDSPEEKLDIKGSLLFKGTFGDPTPRLMKIGPDQANQYSYLGMSGDEYNGLEINYNGYWNGSEEIDVDPTKERSAFSIGRDGQALRLWTAETNGINHLNRTTKFVIGYDGNVGIGTDNPEEKLDINGILLFKGTAGDTIPKYIKMGPDQRGMYSYIVMSGDEYNGLELNYNGYWSGSEEIDVDPTKERSAFSIGRDGQALRLWTAETNGISHLNRTTKFVIGYDGNVGIGPDSPRSKLQVTDGDVYVATIGNGIIITSPDGQCWRITVDNSGNLTTSAVDCP
jgi:hypothetical protein